VNSHLQLQEICSSATPCRADFFAEFALSDEDIINPSLWRL